MEKLLGEQRWKLQALPLKDRRTGRQCVLQGERVHSTRRDNVRPGSPGKPDTGGGDLDIWADRKSCGQHYAVGTSLKVEAAKMRKLSQIGPPDAPKGACPVRVGARQNSAVEKQKWTLSFDSHSGRGEYHARQLFKRLLVAH